MAYIYLDGGMPLNPIKLNELQTSGLWDDELCVQLPNSYTHTHASGTIKSKPTCWHPCSSNYILVDSWSLSPLIFLKTSACPCCAQLLAESGFIR